MNHASLANLRPNAPWKPGESGNSRTKSKGYMRVLRAARDASPEAMEKLIRCMRDETADWQARIRACNIILDRAWGTEAKVEIDQPERVTAIQIVIEHAFAEPAAAAPAPALPQQHITIDSEPAGSGDD